MVAEHPGFHFQRCVLTQPQHIQLVFAYINANKCHLSIPPLVYAASSRLGRARIPYRLRERSEPDLRRRVIALRSATGFRPTKVLVANQHSGRDTRSTALGAKAESNHNTEPAPFAPGAGAPTLPIPAPARFPVGAPPRCECGVKPQPPSPPPSHPGRVPSGVLRQPRFPVDTLLKVKLSCAPH